MPSSRHSSAMLSSPRKPAITTLTFLFGPNTAAVPRAECPERFARLLGMPLCWRSHRFFLAGYDELKSISYSISRFCLTGAEEEQATAQRARSWRKLCHSVIRRWEKFLKRTKH